MSDRDWEKELAEIDRRIASEPAAEPPATRTSAATPRAAVVAPPPARSAPSTVSPRDVAPAAKRSWKAVAGLLLRLTIAAVLLAVVVVWPYETRCGTWLYGYLATIGVTALVSVWSAVAAWRHRGALVHLLSLGMLATALVYGALEILPRVGYAVPDPAHPAMWSCG